MMSPFRRAMSVCLPLLLIQAMFLVATNRTGVRASASDPRERGAMVFHSRGCERCHSIAGVGGDRAPDLGSVGAERDARQIKTQILKGGHGMPPFADVLSKDEVKDLLEFLKACRSKTAPGCGQWLPSPAAQ
jgi:mono/diheme cytochrome c family protein